MSGKTYFYDVKFLRLIFSLLPLLDLFIPASITFLPHCPHSSLFYFSEEKVATSPAFLIYIYFRPY